MSDDYNNLDYKWFDITFKIAQSQTPKFGYRFAATLVHRDSLISVGTNVEKTHPFAAKYGRNPDATYWHAETHAIYLAYKAETPRKIFQKSTLYVVRLKIHKNRKSEELKPGIARPCKGCMNCINVFEIPRIVYSLDNVKDFGVCEIP